MIKVGFDEVGSMVIEVAINGYDYTHQAWVVDGRYVSCSHPKTMKCGCFGRAHAGEPVLPGSEVH